jgi:hypothetical protein
MNEFHKTSSGILSRNLTGQKRMTDIFKLLKGKEFCQPGILYLGKLSFRNEGKIKTFTDKS